MKIVLRVDGNEKTFTEDNPVGIVFRKALELNKKIREGVDLAKAETYDEFVDFLVFAFGNKFTSEEVWYGLSIPQIQTESTRIFNEVLSLGGLVTQPNDDEVGNEEGK